MSIDSISPASSFTYGMSSINDDNTSLRENDDNFRNLVSSLSQVIDKSTSYTNSIDSYRNPATADYSPAGLLNLQNLTADYNNLVMGVSTVARKLVTTIETLEKS